MAVQFNGSKFKSMVIAKNWKLKDLAEKMDLNPQTISNWSNGAYCFPLRLIEALLIVGYKEDEVVNYKISDFYIVIGHQHIAPGAVLELLDDETTFGDVYIKD